MSKREPEAGSGGTRGGSTQTRNSMPKALESENMALGGPRKYIWLESWIQREINGSRSREAPKAMARCFNCVVRVVEHMLNLCLCLWFRETTLAAQCRKWTASFASNFWSRRVLVSLPPPDKFQWMCKNYIKMMFSVSLICQSLKEGVWTRESHPLSQSQSLTVCSMKCFLHTELENGMGMKRNAHHSDLAGVNSVAIYA